MFVTLFYINLLNHIIMYMYMSTVFKYMYLCLFVMQGSLVANLVLGMIILKRRYCVIHRIMLHYVYIVNSTF